MLGELRGDARERLEVLEAARRRQVAGWPTGDELLEQRRLAACRRPEGTQVPCVETVACKASAGGRDLDVALAVDPLAGLDPRRDQVVLLEPAGREIPPIPARSQNAASSSSPLASRSAGGRRLGPPAPASSASLITRSGRNSSRWSRRIVSRRSTSPSEKSR